MEPNGCPRPRPLDVRLADLIEEEIDELAALETLDNGKPIRDARAADLPLVIDCLRYYAGWADKIHGETIPIRGNYFTYTRREPVGVVGQIIPWNFPMLMAAWKWGPALAAGCTIVMKPAEQTPLTCLRMARAGSRGRHSRRRDQRRARLRPDGRRSAGQASGRRQDRVHRRASHRSDHHARCGRHTEAADVRTRRQEPERHLRRCRSRRRRRRGTNFGLFFNQGQCCCAGSRVFVEEKVHDEFVEKLVASGLHTQARRSASTRHRTGPASRSGAVRQDHELHRQGQSGRGQVHRPAANAIGERGYFIEPTIFAGVHRRHGDRTGRNLRPGDERPQVQAIGTK